MEPTLKHIEIIYEPQREGRKYAIYRTFTNGLRQLWTVELIEKSAIRVAQTEIKKYKSGTILLQSKRTVRHG